MAITRRYFLKSALATSVGLSFVKGCNSSKILNTRPNIIFFLIDDQRNDTLGCAGHPIIQTPTIDSLAAKGCRFTNAFVTTSICAASRASIVTGLYERTHGYTFGTPPLNEAYIAQSYPILLKQNGYRTGFVGKLGMELPEGSIERMFNYFQPIDRNPYFHQMPDGSKKHETDLAADYTIEFLRQNPVNTPFAISVSFNAAHAEDSDKENHYPSPPSVDGMYEDIVIPPPELWSPEIFESLPEFLQNSINRGRFFWRWDTPEKYQKNMRAYFRMITGIDFAIARVLEELNNLNLAQNTIIIYMADNGYYMGNRGFAGKWSHFEESLRIPLIIYDPRISELFRGIVTDSMALNIDIPSSIMDLAGIAIPEKYQGKSLIALIYGKNNMTWRQDFFCEHLMNHGGIPKWEGVRGKQFVYARYFEQQPVFEFLHDLNKDPNQLINFSKDENYQKVLQQVRKRCNQLKNKYSKAKQDF